MPFFPETANPKQGKPCRGRLTTVDTFFNKKRQITHFPFEAVYFTVDTSDIYNRSAHLHVDGTVQYRTSL